MQRPHGCSEKDPWSLQFEVHLINSDPGALASLHNGEEIDSSLGAGH